MNFKGFEVIFSGGTSRVRGWEEGEWEDPPYKPFGVTVTTWHSYKVSTNIYGTMAAVPGHGPPKGTIFLTVTSKALQKSRPVYNEQ